MYHRRYTQLPCRHHDIQYLAISKFQRIIGHVELDAGDTFLDDNRKLLLHNFLGGISEDEMVRIITIRASFGESTVFLDDRKNRIVLPVLRSECNDGCRPTTHCTARASHPSIASWSVPLLEMNVRIDAARGDESAFAVEYLSISRTQTLQVAADTNDNSMFDTNFLANDGIYSVDLVHRVSLC
jgi:hypothetical protein